jgi:hypothetical protein
MGVQDTPLADGASRVGAYACGVLHAAIHQWECTMGLEFAIVLFALVLVPAVVWLGVWIWQDRQRHHGHPGSTEGGERTIYRRRIVRDESDASHPA